MVDITVKGGRRMLASLKAWLQRGSDGTEEVRR